MATQDDYVKTALRLPRDLHARIQRSADETSKSLNAEFVARLESSFSGGDQAALITAIARLNADLARAELEKQQLQIQAAYVAQSALQAAELLKERLHDDEEVSDLAHAFIARATPLAVDVNSLHEEYRVKSEAVVRAVTEVRQSYYPHSYRGKALEEENARRKQLGLPVWKSAAEINAETGLVADGGNSSTALPQAKEVKAPKHDLPKTAPAEAPARRVSVAKAKARGEAARPDPKKTVKN